MSCGTPTLNLLEICCIPLPRMLPSFDFSFFADLKNRKMKKKLTSGKLLAEDSTADSKGRKTPRESNRYKCTKVNPL
jgi:hypothetical protein